MEYGFFFWIISSSVCGLGFCMKNYLCLCLLLPFLLNLFHKCWTYNCAFIQLSKKDFCECSVLKALFVIGKLWTCLRVMQNYKLNTSFVKCFKSTNIGQFCISSQLVHWFHSTLLLLSLSLLLLLLLKRQKQAFATSFSIIFRTRGTRRPFGHSRSTRAPEVSTSSNDNKIEDSDQKADKVKEEDKITQLYPDPDYDEEEGEESEASPTPSPKPATTTERKFSPTTRTQTTFQTTPKLDTTTTTSAEETTTEPFFVTPLTEATESSSSSAASAEPGYNPCSLADACGPNAICEAPTGVDPVCKCPPGFSGIPRDGSPDPAHGCVRTPVKCSEPESDVCPESTVCIRDYCLPSCEVDVECSLGERCVDGACIKICFYDAHCLAGEFCEKTEESGGNGVCLSGCRRDTNCPFGQVCKDRKCEDGCHFNNDCTQNTACINGTCTDPCRDFTECGANAVCNAVSHAPACSCPEGLRELNSPYEACVPEGMNLSDLECLRSSDCQSGFECKDWQCKQS